MKKIILLILTITTFTGFCQKADSIKVKKISIGFCVNPTYCYEKLKADTVGMVEQIVALRNKYDIPKLGFGAGIKINVKINKRIDIESGIIFTNRGIIMKDITISDPNSGDSIGSATSNYHYNYLDIPLKINYNFTTGKFKLFITAGFSANIFLSQTITTHLDYYNGRKVTESGSNKYVDYFTKLNYSLFAGVGLDYNINKNFHLSFEPLYNCMLKNVYNINKVKMDLFFYSAGLSISLYCRPF